MRPQTAPAWIEAQPYEPVRALGKGGFERCQRRLVAAEPGLYQSNAIGCNKAATSEPVQLSECGSRLLAAARHPLDKAARRNRDRPFGCRRLDGAECRERGITLAKFLICAPEPELRRREIGLHRQDRLQLLGRLGVL